MTTAVAVATKRSPFRALLWKEWRVQRALAVAGVLPALFLMLGAWLAAHESTSYPYRATGDVMIGMSVVIMALMAMLLGANAFVREEEDGTVQFMASLPAGRAAQFLAKYIVALGVLCGAAILAAPWWSLLLRVFVSSRECPTWISIPTSLAMLFVLPGLISLAAQRVVTCLLCMLFLAPFVLAWMAFWIVCAFLGSGSNWILIGGALLSIVTWATLIGWLWVHHTRWGRLKRVALGLGAIVIALAAPMIVYTATWLGFIFTPPSHSLSYTAFLASSPDGRHVLVYCRSRTWQSVTGVYVRPAVLDVQTGRVKWVSRWQMGSFRFSDNVWSPDSSRYLVALSRIPWLPTIRPEHRDYRDARFIPQIVTAATGKVERINHVSIGKWAALGWVDSRTAVVASSNDRDAMVTFVGPTGTTQRTVPAKDGRYFEVRSITSKGAMGVMHRPHGNAEAILRVAPDQKEPQIVSLPADRKLVLDAVSPDGHWAQLWEIDERGGLGTPLLMNAETMELVHSADAALAKLRDWGWAFTPDDESIFLSRNAYVAVVNIATGNLRIFDLLNGRQVEAVELAAESARPMDVRLAPSAPLLFVRGQWNSRTGSQYLAIFNWRTGECRAMPSLDNLAPGYRNTDWLGDDALVTYGLSKVTLDGKETRLLP